MIIVFLYQAVSAVKLARFFVFHKIVVSLQAITKVSSESKNAPLKVGSDFTKNAKVLL